MTLQTKRGTLTAYAINCGYIERKRKNEKCATIGRVSGAYCVYLYEREDLRNTRYAATVTHAREAVKEWLK